MNKLAGHPLYLTAILFVFMQAVGYLAGYISWQLLPHIPHLPEQTATYINMLITELLPLGALLLVFKSVITSLSQKKKPNSTSPLFAHRFPYLLLFLPVIIQIGWDVSSLFLEKICITLLSPAGLGFFLLCLAATISIALSEETVWRKIIFESMCQKWNTVKGIVISSLLFGAVHYMNILNGQQTFAATTLQVIQAIGMGMFLACLYDRTNSFTLIVLIHGLCNFSNFFCNELIGWNYAGYPWDNACQAAFTILYFAASCFMIIRSIHSHKLNTP